MGWGGSVHCTWYAGTLPIGFWLAFWCEFIGNANHMRTVFAFCFVLECCKHQAGKNRMLVCVSGSAQNSTGFEIRSVHFHPTPLTRPFFSNYWGSGMMSSCFGTCIHATEVQTPPSWYNRPVLESHVYIIKVWLKTVITFASPQSARQLRFFWRFL